MKFNFVTGGAVAALAAALAFTAVPAAAREADGHGNRSWQQSSDDSGQRGRGQARSQERAAQPQRNYTPQARQPQRSYTPQAQQVQRNGGQPARLQQQQQRSWTPQAREGQRTWSQQARQTQIQRPQSNWNGARRDGNRTYVDGNRNTTYRDASRSGSYDRTRNYDRTRSYNRDSRQWDRSWRNDNRYDWQRYRATNRNVYHVGRYYAPYRNYSYRRLSIGFALDPLFFGQDYWIGDPGYYRLPAVYGPYRWVRYYDDALLVDIYSGEVVDVIYDFFW